MYSRNSFGSYYPINSLIHRLNSVIKLINFVLAILLICLSTSVYVNSFILMLVIIMILMTNTKIIWMNIKNIIRQMFSNPFLIRKYLSLIYLSIHKFILF